MDPSSRDAHRFHYREPFRSRREPLAHHIVGVLRGPFKLDLSAARLLHLEGAFALPQSQPWRRAIDAAAVWRVVEALKELLESRVAGRLVVVRVVRQGIFREVERCREIRIVVDIPRSEFLRPAPTQRWGVISTESVEEQPRQPRGATLGAKYSTSAPRTSATRLGCLQSRPTHRSPVPAPPPYHRGRASPEERVPKSNDGGTSPTAHCSLLTAHCSLPTAHCSLLTAHCPHHLHSYARIPCRKAGSPSCAVGSDRFPHRGSPARSRARGSQQPVSESMV